MIDKNIPKNIPDSLKIIHKTLDDHQGNGRQWNALNIAIDRVAAELGYEFRADDELVCVKPDMKRG
tara:strand:+ start:1728 stop:1925 length:198 start_codon:yes stop_codon:yes gene_type:complete